MNGSEFSIIAGNQLLIGLLQESYTVALSGEYDVAGVPSSSFIDYESDFPIRVVDKSWKTSSNWPGDEMVWVEEQGLLFSPDFNSTDATPDTVYQVNVTIEDSLGM